MSRRAGAVLASNGSVAPQGRSLPSGPARLAHNPAVPSLLTGVVALAIVALLAGHDRWEAASALVVVYALATVGLNFAQGAAGMFTLGTAAFIGVGGYATGYLTTRQGWPALAAMAAGCVISAAVGALFALLTLRISEIYLAIATLALVQIFGGLVLVYSGITNGVDGISKIPPLSALGFRADTLVKVSVCNVVVLTVLSVVAATLLRGRAGRSFRAIREDRLAASGSGVPVNRSLNLSFVLAAVYASVAGSLFAHTIAFVDPTAFTLDLSVITIAMLVIGGSGSVVGAVIGAGLLQFAAEYLTKFRGYSQLMFGLVIVFGALVSPVGIVGGVRLVSERVLRRTRRSDAEPVGPGIPLALGDGGVATHPDVTFALSGPAKAGAPTLVADGVAKAFGGVKALRGVSVMVRAGEVHALIGPNGSGKSTFINVVSGIYAADAGTVTVGGRRIDGEAVAKRSRSGLARTYQNGRLFKSLSVQENVRIAGDHRNRQAGAVGSRFPGVTGEAWVDLVVDLVGVRQLEASMAGSLGFGNQRRVELARALALDPWFLLLDEPAAGLAGVEKRQLTELLGLFRRIGMGVLLVEHTMDVVMEIADTVTVLDFGEVIGRGTPAEIRADRRVIDVYLGVA